MKQAITAVRSAGEVRWEERAVAGHAGGVVWVIASLSVIAMALALPGAQVQRGAVVALGLGGCLWGAFSGLCLDYRRLPAWAIHLSAVTGVAALAVAISLSGGARSPAWACLFYVVMFAAYFFKPLAAAAYFSACVVADVIALVSSSNGAGAEGTATLVIAAPAFIVLGVQQGARARPGASLRAREHRRARHHLTPAPRPTRVGRGGRRRAGSS